MADLTHASVTFQGHVQGVGFRYAVLQAAGGFEIAGFVQNLPDGRVLLEAEGAPAEVQAFIDAVEEAMQSFIRSTQRSQGSRPAQFRGFVIR